MLDVELELVHVPERAHLPLHSIRRIDTDIRSTVTANKRQPLLVRERSTLDDRKRESHFSMRHRAQLDGDNIDRARRNGMRRWVRSELHILRVWASACPGTRLRQGLQKGDPLLFFCLQDPLILVANGPQEKGLSSVR